MINTKRREKAKSIEMSVLRSRNTIVLCVSILSILSLIPTSCYGFKSQSHPPFQSVNHKQQPKLLLQEPTSRFGFDKSILSNEPVVLLQEDGIVDYIKTLYFNLPSELTEDDVEFMQTTSDPLVLNVTSGGNSNLAFPPSASVASSLNVTTSVLFDGMGGAVQYTLMAINKNTQEQIDFISIVFRICGITLYRELPSGEIDIVSGESNKLSITYQEAMSQTIIWQKYIKCFIQYADGRTSTNFVNKKDNNFKLPDGENLVVQVNNVKGQINHNSTLCSISSVGSQTMSGNPVLPFGCGTGFYFGYSSDLSFGFLFNDYRVGSIQLQFTWPGINNNYPPLAMETYELTCNVEINGEPPLAVVAIEPFNNMLRQEGGQIRTIKMINVDMADAIMFEMRVLGLTRPFKMIPESFVKGAAPEYVDQISIITEPGSGSDLTWSVYYQTLNGSIEGTEYKEAIFLSSFIHSFSFDSSKLRIESMNPTYAFGDGSGNGGNGDVSGDGGNGNGDGGNGDGGNGNGGNSDGGDGDGDGGNGDGGNGEGGNGDGGNGDGGNGDGGNGDGGNGDGGNVNGDGGNGDGGNVNGDSGNGDGGNGDGGNGDGGNVNGDSGNGDGGNGDGGNDTSGTSNITLTGYFPFFDPEVDSIQFSGYRIPFEYIISIKMREIVFRIPPREQVGDSYDYSVTVHIGYGKSNPIMFSYYVTNPSISFRMIGLSKVAKNTYRFGDCSYTTLAVAVSPYINQVESFEWFLYSVGNSSGNNLLEDKSLFHTANSTSQSITIESDMMDVGTYILRVEVKLLKAVIESEILILRENVLSIGASILPIGNQTLSEIGSILRFVAVVTEPTCLSVDGRLIFEWEGFGTKQIYSWQNSTFVPSLPSDISVTRLGWEFVVPEKYIEVGSYDISLKAYVNGNESIHGSATTTLNVEHGPLLAVIRNGEKQLNVNSKSSLAMYSNNSYDTDVQNENRFDAITYEWSCVISLSTTFSPADTAPCPDSLLPDPTLNGFTVSLSFLKVRTSIRYIQYSLVARKGSGRISPKQTLLLQVQEGGGKPYFEDYSISLSDAEGEFMCANMTDYYQDVIIHIDTPHNGTTWTYDLVGPVDLSFFSSNNIYDHSSYYAPPSTIIQSVFGKRGENKPLGIRANVLSPSTVYTFRITFYNDLFEVTQVTLNIRTIDSIVVYMSEPSFDQVTINTPLALTAGVSSISNQYSYYFTMKDSEGNEYCAGGCTGNDVTFFTISRADNYSMSTFVFDTKGRVITSTTSPKLIEVVENAVGDGNETVEIPPTGNDTDNNNNLNDLTRYENELSTLYEYGNDQQWLQTAHDVSIILLGKDNGRGQVGQQTDYTLNLVNDSKAIFCNSFPNTFQGQDCIKFLYRIAQLTYIDSETFYFIIETATCCVKKTPPNTIISVIQWLPSLISELVRVAKDLNQVGTTRRRLLQEPGTPANAVADVYTWTSEIMSYAVASGMYEGFTQEYSIGNGKSTGYLTVSIASQVSDLQEEVVNGVKRNIVKGPSSNELFYARDECFNRLFSMSKRRVVTFLTVDNFVLLGFQNEPIQGNLNDKVYWTQVYEKDSNGQLEQLSLNHDDQYCYCWRLPVTRMKEQLLSTVDIMPGLYGVTDLKVFQNDAEQSGLVYRYDYSNSKTSDYNISKSWMEGCRVDIGLVGSTVISKSASNILDAGLSIIGFNAWAVVGLVVGGIMLIMVAIVSSWMIAVRAVSDGVAAADVEAETTVYVERDIYGRGTMFGGLLFRNRSRE